MLSLKIEGVSVSFEEISKEVSAIIPKIIDTFTMG